MGLAGKPVGLAIFPYLGRLQEIPQQILFGCSWVQDGGGGGGGGGGQGTCMCTVPWIP